MAWIKSRKVYAILMGEKEGRKIVAEAPELTEIELKRKLDDFFNSNSSTYGDDYEDDDEFENENEERQQILTSFGGVGNKFYGELPAKTKEVIARLQTEEIMRVNGKDLIDAMFGKLAGDESFLNFTDANLENFERHFADVCDGIIDVKNSSEEEVNKAIFDYFNQLQYDIIDANEQDEIKISEEEENQKVNEVLNRLFKEANDRKRKNPQMTKDVTKYGGFDRPTAVFCLGTAGSGKTVHGGKSIMSKYDMIEIDNDICKDFFQIYKDNPANVSRVHEAAGRVRDKVHQKMVEEKRNLFLPKVGDRPDKMKKDVEKLKAAGYDVYVMDVRVNRNQNIKQVCKRALGGKEGRFTSPMAFLHQKFYDGVDDTMDHFLGEWRGMVKGVCRINNGKVSKNDGFFEF